MNRNVNEGYAFNKQKDMLPLVGLLNESLEKDNYLLKELENRLGVDKEDIVDFDLFLYEFEKGCFIAEIQQTSNVTYRIYDFNRKDKNGNTRELHTELSKDAIDYSVEEDYRTHYTPKQNESVELVTCPYFTTSVYDFTERHRQDNKNQ